MHESCEICIIRLFLTLACTHTYTHAGVALQPHADCDVKLVMSCICRRTLHFISMQTLLDFAKQHCRGGHRFGLSMLSQADLQC